VPATEWTARTSPATDRPSTLTVDQLAGLFGRVPVGISTVQDPGPYHATWTTNATNTLWLSRNGILDVQRTDRMTLTLSGGGLAHPRTLTLTEPYWAVPERAAGATADRVAAAEATARDRALWRVWLPIAFGVTAAGLAVGASRSRRSLARSDPSATDPRAASTRRAPASHEPSRRSSSHAVQ
jgi:high-affinity iron transporter